MKCNCHKAPYLENDPSDAQHRTGKYLVGHRLAKNMLKLD